MRRGESKRRGEERGEERKGKRRVELLWSWSLINRNQTNQTSGLCSILSIQERKLIECVHVCSQKTGKEVSGLASLVKS